MKFSKKAFSLTELLVAVSILMVLTAIIVPRYFIYKDEAKRTEAYERIQAIVNAEKLIYPIRGTYILWSPNGGGNERQQKSIGNEVVLEKDCPEGEDCHYYDYALDVAGTEDFAYRRSSTFVDLYYTPTSAYSKNFGVRATSDINEDSDNYADVLVYDSTKNVISLICDDIEKSNNAGTYICTY